MSSTTLNAWPALRVSRWKGALTSSDVPNTPSLPELTSETPLVDRIPVSSGSSKVMSTERTKKRRDPSSRFIDVTTGGKVSATTSSVTAFDNDTLPPVSVARTRSVTVLPPTESSGAWVKSS